jgi:hypothetical protein
MRKFINFNISLIKLKRFCNSYQQSGRSDDQSNKIKNGSTDWNKAGTGFKAGVKDYRLTYYTPDYQVKTLIF